MSLIPSPAVAPAVGFKDWAVVCDALGRGRQSIILRKGGIAEGREGFRFKHERFFLFPTGYHQQFEKVRPGEAGDASPSAVATNAEVVEIRFQFVLEFAYWVDDLEQIARLQPFHIWREEAIRDRYNYDEPPGLQCAFGRVFRSQRAWTFPNRPFYGGCRSWVTLPETPDDLEFSPVIEDPEHAQRREAVLRIVRPLQPIS